MREETLYLKTFTERLNLIVEKIDNGGDLDPEDYEIMRTVHSLYCKREKLLVEN